MFIGNSCVYTVVKCSVLGAYRCRGEAQEGILHPVASVAILSLQNSVLTKTKLMDPCMDGWVDLRLAGWWLQIRLNITRELTKKSVNQIAIDSWLWPFGGGFPQQAIFRVRVEIKVHLQTRSPSIQWSHWKNLPFDCLIVSRNVMAQSYEGTTFSPEILDRF